MQDYFAEIPSTSIEYCEVYKILEELDPCESLGPLFLSISSLQTLSHVWLLSK